MTLHPVTGGKVALAMSVMALVFSFVAMVLVGLRSFLGKIQSPTPAMGLCAYQQTRYMHTLARFCCAAFVIHLFCTRNAQRMHAPPTL